MHARTFATILVIHASGIAWEQQFNQYHENFTVSLSRWYNVPTENLQGSISDVHGPIDG